MFRSNLEPQVSLQRFLPREDIVLLLPEDKPTVFDIQRLEVGVYTSTYLLIYLYTYLLSFYLSTYLHTTFIYLIIYLGVVPRLRGVLRADRPRGQTRQVASYSHASHLNLLYFIIFSCHKSQ